MDWQANSIKVTSPKTAHHEGLGKRTIPLCGELRPYLEEAFNPENEYVVTRYRDASQNLRTHFNRIVTKAGLTPWHPPFHAMRKMRQTELTDRGALEHSVCRWLRNSVTVAREFYRVQSLIGGHGLVPSPRPCGERVRGLRLGICPSFHANSPL